MRFFDDSRRQHLRALSISAHIRRDPVFCKNALCISHSHVVLCLNTVLLSWKKFVEQTSNIRTVYVAQQVVSWLILDIFYNSRHLCRFIASCLIKDEHEPQYSVLLKAKAQFLDA